MLITPFTVSEFVTVIVFDCRKKKTNTAMNIQFKKRWTKQSLLSDYPKAHLDFKCG